MASGIRKEIRGKDWVLAIVASAACLAACDGHADSVPTDAEGVEVIEYLVDPVAIVDLQGDLAGTVNQKDLPAVPAKVNALTTKGAFQVLKRSGEAVWLDPFDVKINAQGESVKDLCTRLAIGRPSDSTDRAAMGLGPGCEGR